MRYLFLCLLLGVATSYAQINLIKDIHPSNKTWPATPFHEVPRGIWSGYQVGNYLYFIGDDSLNGREPWVTDGTTEGTFMIADIYPGMQNPFARGIVGRYAHLGDYLFQTANDSTNREQILVFDISDPGNPEIHKKLIPNGEDRWIIASDFIAYKDHIYFAAGDAGTINNPQNVELWRANEDGVELFAEINPTLPARSSNPDDFFLFQDHLYFMAYNDSVGREFWRTDGQTVELFVDLSAGDNIRLAGMSELNGEWIFTAYNGYPNGADQFGDALWKSDGTAAGTQMIYDFPNDSEEFAIQDGQDFIEYNGALYFWASDSIHGYELWRTDGTTTGTFMVKDIEPGIETSNRDVGRANEGILHGVVLDGTLYFRIFGSSSTANWKTDGTEVGTQSANNDWIGSFLLNKYGNYLPIEYQGKYLGVSVAGTYNSNEVIWSDGTIGRTQVLQELMPGSTPSAPSEFWVLGNKLVFSAQDAISGFELRVVDLNSVHIADDLASISALIYPNPGKDLIRIRLGDIPKQQETTIQMIDALGKTVKFEANWMGEEWQITTENIASGLYFISITHPDYQPEIVKWLKE